MFYAVQYVHIIQAIAFRKCFSCPQILNSISKVLHLKFVTRPEKTSLIYKKYTCSYYGEYLLFCTCYIKSASFIEFLLECCMYDDIFVKILRKLLHFKVSKLNQILCVDKIGFLTFIE